MVDGRTLNTRLLITELGQQKIILGYPWLQEHNPDIDWQTGKFNWRIRRPLKVKRYHGKPTEQTPPLTNNETEQPIRSMEIDGSLKIRLHSKNTRLPMRGTPGAAGYDLYSAEEKTIPSGGKALIDTQISLATPLGTYGHIAPRSGLAAKNMIATGVGVIDSDYRGVIFVLLFNHSDEDFEVKKGDRVAQLILEKNDTPRVERVTELSQTERGDQGFGSTGGTTPSENPSPETDVLIARIGKTNDRDEVWIATTKELLTEDEVWINTKTSNSIEFHLLHDKKDDTFLLTK